MPGKNEQMCFVHLNDFREVKIQLGAVNQVGNSNTAIDRQADRRTDWQADSQMDS